MHINLFGYTFKTLYIYIETELETELGDLAIFPNQRVVNQSYCLKYAA